MIKEVKTATVSVLAVHHWFSDDYREFKMLLLGCCVANLLGLMPVLYCVCCQFLAAFSSNSVHWCLTSITVQRHPALQNSVGVVMTRNSALRLVGTTWCRLHAFSLLTNPLQ